VKSRVGLRTMMLTVVWCALLSALAIELAVWRPIRTSRRSLLDHHVRMKAYFDAELDQSAARMYSEALEGDILDAAAWHARRLRELRALPGFDPTLERAKDLTHQPYDEDLRDQISMHKASLERSF
jgi:hypothetical protein